MAAAAATATAEPRPQNRWWVLYPVYINSLLKVSDGRRLAKKYCVENPTAMELYEICLSLKLEAQLERDKAHPRDFLSLGRVRVLLKDSAGKPLNEKVPTKDALLKYAGEMIPKLKSRVQGGGSSSSQPSDSSGGGGGSSKKGKKGRKKK